MLRHYGYATVGQVGSVILAVLGLAIVTRRLGPTDYGSYIVLMTMVALLSVAVSAGPSAAALVISSRQPGSRASLHGQIVVATGGLCIVTALAAPLFAGPVAGAVGSAVDPGMVLINFIRLPAVVYSSLVTTQLSGAGQVGTAAALAIASAGLALLASAGALLADNHLQGAIAGSTVGGLASAAIAGIVATRVFGLERPGGIDAWRRAAAVAVPMHIGTVAYWIMLRLDVIVVGAILGPTEAGTYGLALGISERVSMLTTPLYNATAWRVSGPDRSIALRTMLQVARLEFAIGIVIAVGAGMAGPLLVAVLSGSEFSAAALPLAILVVGAAALPVWAAVGLYLVSHLGGAWTTAWLQVAIAVVSVLGYAVLTRIAGSAGAAGVSTGAYLILLVSGLVLIRRESPFPWRDLLPGPEVIRLRRALVVLSASDCTGNCARRDDPG